MLASDAGRAIDAEDGQDRKPGQREPAKGRHCARRTSPVMPEQPSTRQGENGKRGADEPYPWLDLRTQSVRVNVPVDEALELGRRALMRSNKRAACDDLT